MARRYEVAGRTVLITGAARGIGLDVARRLGAKSANLALIDLNVEPLEEAAAELGPNAEPFVGDVSDRDSIAAAIEAARERFGGIDVAIANAGISGTATPAAHTPHDQFERVIETNLLGVWRTLHGVLADVAERKGYLLPIASLAAATPMPMTPAYAASKAGVHSLARSLRMELAHTGARVGCGYFSFIDTPMVREAFEQPHVARARTRARFDPKPLPVGAAGEAIVRGIERRSNRVYAPRWVGPAVMLNGLAGPLEALAARDPRFVRGMREAAAAELAAADAAEERVEEPHP